MIALQNVNLFVAGRKLLRELSFEVKSGELVAVLGANGAGKTTLLRTIAGLHASHSGSIEIDGQEISSMAAAERSRRLAFVTSDDVFEDRLTVREVVAAGRYPHHRWWQWREETADADAIARALQAVDLHGFSQREFATLSSGERQRAWIALALAQASPLLLLDEPTSHLDVRIAQEILRLLRAQVSGGKTALCVLHDPNEAAAFADRVLVLGDGGILTLAEPKTALAPEVLEQAYGVPMESVVTGAGSLRVFPRQPA